MSAVALPLCDPDSLAQDDSCASAPLPLPENNPCLCHPPCQPLLDARCQAGFYKSLHRRAREREDRLKLEVAQLRAENRDLRHRVFGRSSEVHYTHNSLPGDDPSAKAAPADPAGDSATSPAATSTQADNEPPRRRRGQQRGSKGHGRRDYSHLTAREEVSSLPEEQCRCQRCGQPFADFPGTDDTTVLEVEVKAHRRLIHRKRYRPTCTCGVHPGVITAPPPARLIPKSPFGVSIWVNVLLDKYQFYRPTQRLLEDWRSHGLDLSQGALTGGLQRLLPLFEPLNDALIERSQQQTLWHADETRWMVFQSIEGKVGYHWYLWVFHTEEAVVFTLATGRSHTVPEAHFGPVEGGILVADRYVAYPAIDKVKAGQIVLALCWAHQRRDFVELARSWPEQREWASAWLARIRALYRLNDRRLELREDSEGFEQRDRDLRGAVDAMAAQAEQELKEPELHPARRKALQSLGEYWTGLTVFLEHPEVPMDNNTAERAERGPVVGRKNYYGSGAVWAGQLAAMLFSLFATLKQWQLNPRAWLTWYLTACAEAGGKVPGELASYLPWNLSAQQREELQKCGTTSASGVDEKCPNDTS